MQSLRAHRSVVVWLAAVCALILAMVAVGGITRLTHSGLSIVEWKPVTGIVPPLTEEAWQAEFAKYQQFPEYQKKNFGMQLHEFKFIFFWEYLHRLLGRLIGVAFLVPWVWFLVRRRIERRLGVKLLVGFFLGGLQGALGWYMVKSGLVDRPSVSHFRLAAHLLLAFAVLGYLFWQILELTKGRGPAGGAGTASRKLLRGAVALLVLAILQMSYGAFTAGLKAGFGYNTFPLMNGAVISPDAFRLEPLWLNFFETPAAVQFVHRTLGWALLLGVVGFWAYARRTALSLTQGRALNLTVFAVGLQFILGVLTLVWRVPVSLGTLHQVGAALVLLVFLNLIHAFRGQAITNTNGPVAIM